MLTPRFFSPAGRESEEPKTKRDNMKRQGIRERKENICSHGEFLVIISDHAPWRQTSLPTWIALDEGYREVGETLYQGRPRRNQTISESVPLITYIVKHRQLSCSLAKAECIGIEWAYDATCHFGACVCLYRLCISSQRAIRFHLTFHPLLSYSRKSFFGPLKLLWLDSENKHRVCIVLSSKKRFLRVRSQRCDVVDA